MSIVNAPDLTFELPMPPSSNNLFATVTIKGKQRRIISRDYKAWRENAGGILAQQYAAYDRPAVGRHASIRIRLNLNHQSDIGNREKAITDLLVAHLDMPDDCWIDRIVIERDRTVEAAVVTIGEGT